MTPAARFRLSVTHLQGRRSQITEAQRQAADAYSRALADASATDLARALLQRASLLTQSQLRYHVTALGSMAMEAIFPTPIALELEFKENRGKTEARLTFKRQSGLVTDPLEGDSGGACSIAGLGLRASMREIQRPRTRPVLILDEPLGHLNDHSRIMHQKAAEMIEQVSRELGVQFLIVTMVPELADIGTAIQI